METSAPPNQTPDHLCIKNRLEKTKEQSDNAVRKVKAFSRFSQIYENMPREGAKVHLRLKRVELTRIELTRNKIDKNKIGKQNKTVAAKRTSANCKEGFAVSCTARRLNHLTVLTTCLQDYKMQKPCLKNKSKAAFKKLATK